MTLKEWCEKADILPTTPTTETKAVSLCANKHSPNFTDLWHLDDYYLTCRIGGVLWFRPKS